MWTLQSVPSLEIFADRSLKLLAAIRIGQHLYHTLLTANGQRLVAEEQLTIILLPNPVGS